MMYLWEAVLGAAEEGISPKDLRFIHSERGSAYMEMALPYLNQEGPLGKRVLEINTYCRFYDSFKDLFRPDLTEVTALRESLTNLTLHMLAENDLRRGMCREEYYKKLLKREILEGVYGRTAKSVWKSMKREEQEILLGGLLRNFRTGRSLLLFMDMVRGLVADSIIYRSRECPDDVIIYTGLKKSRMLEQKFRLLQDLFLDIRYHTEIFYEAHFGIIGIDCTMRTDETAIY